MGIWGSGLYQNDIAEDIKTYYKDQLHRGKSGEKITKELLEKYQNVISDFDDAPIFWFALADTQWNVGRLEKHVKENALYYIDSLLQHSTNNKKTGFISKTAISKLKQKLLEPPPNKKTFSQYKLYHCDWKMGDIYAYQLSSDYAKEHSLLDKFLFFIKIGETTWHPGHKIPIVKFFWIMTDKLPTIEQLKTIDFIPQFFKPKAYTNNPSLEKQYALSLVTTSLRVLPQNNLTFMGNIENFEFVNTKNIIPYSIEWKDFEKYIIENFHTWNDFMPHY